MLSTTWQKYFVPFKRLLIQLEGGEGDSNSVCVYITNNFTSFWFLWLVVSCIIRTQSADTGGWRIQAKKNKTKKPIKENGFELTKKRSRRYPAKTITDADYTNDIAILANTPNQAETLLHSLKQVTASTGLHVNAHKTEYMCFNQTGDISTLDGTALKLVDKFTYLGSSVSSTEKDIDTRLMKAWTAINKLSIIRKSDLTDKMKRSFFQAAVVSILLYGCTTWMLTKRLEKKLDSNYTRMVQAILNKSWRQHPTRHQLYSHLPPIRKTIQVRRTRHAGHCWRSRDELISDVLLWTPTYGRAKAGQPARTYIQQLCKDTGCSLEDLSEAMNDREKWRERVRDIHAGGMTWWWW